MLVKRFIIFFGISIFFLLNLVPPPANLSENSWLVASLLFLMSFWWISNAIPLSITALLPLIFIPALSDISFKEVSTPYANPIIFLLLGGFIIAQGLERSNLHKRVAIRILLFLGSQRKDILKGFIVSTAFLSMWLSNTATCLLMLPIAVSILEKMKIKDDSIFRKVLFISIAYSASIGGMGTLIGTAPNAIFAGFLLENYEVELSFLDWMFFSIPLVFLLLLILWFYMNRVSYDTDVISGNNNIFVDEYHDLGSMTLKEKLSLIIISLTVFLWIFKSYISDFINISLSDSNIAIFGAILFFILPTGKDGAILKKDWFKSIPWNILILFGGGLSLASLVTSSGLASWLGESLFFLKDFHLFLIIILIALLISFLTEVTSNTATTLLFLPIIIAFAVSNQLDFIILALPVVIAASCAFMMPIATPPNAIIFSTNAIKISFMVSNGFKMNLVAILISSLWIYFFSFILIS